MKFHGADKILAATVFLLAIFGLAVISSASVVESYNNFGNNYYYLSHQFFNGFLPGAALLFLIQRMDYHVLKNYAWLFLILTIILLLIVFVPGLGFEAKGASRWIVFWGINFQPSEIAKLTFILYLATWFDNKGKQIESFYEGLIPFALIIFVIALLLKMQPDIGTFIIIASTAATMYFVAGAKTVQVGALLAIGAAGLFFMVKMSSYSMNRLMVFMHPELDPQGIGYQINQALLALGSGGIFGLGFGHSRQKFNYLPEPIGDSIFAVMGEELGFIGLLFVIFLFLNFALRGFKIAANAPDKFGRLIAVGFTSWIVLQALTNIAAITSLIPLTGIPLPFISYGGSSLIAAFVSTGILLSVSRQGKRR